MRISQSVISSPELKYSKTVYTFTEQGVPKLLRKELAKAA